MDYLAVELLGCAITEKYQCRMNWQDYQNKKLKWMFDLELLFSPGAIRFTVNAIFVLDKCCFRVKVNFYHVYLINYSVNDIHVFYVVSESI